MENDLADDTTNASDVTCPQLQLIYSLIGRLEPSLHNNSKSFAERETIKSKFIYKYLL